MPTGAPMPSFDGFNVGDVIKVPFPYTDRATRQRRPALIVSTYDLERDHGLLWVLMITSAENRGWPGDVPVTAPANAGLPVPSVIRTAKIATIEARDAELLGKVRPAVIAAVARRLAAILGLNERNG
ncbi:MAG: type II toxin-antitoxin system PemK/MazF family toxin [Candidatus Binatia bacterium]